MRVRAKKLRGGCTSLPPSQAGLALPGLIHTASAEFEPVTASLSLQSSASDRMPEPALGVLQG